MRFNGSKISLLADKAKISTMVTMLGHASNGHCLPTSFDINLLDIFRISPSFPKFKDIEMIIWKPLTHPYIKVNTDGSLRNLSAVCGGIFRDQTSAFMGDFSTNLGDYSVFEAEIMGFIIAMEMAVTHHLRYIWIEGDLTNALLAFSHPSLIPIRWRNCWHNCLSRGM